MKTIYTAALITACAMAALPVRAADTHSAHTKPVSTPVATQSVPAEGVVKKIDKANARVTLNHGPLPNGMPAMTMPFKVRDAAWLDKLKVDQKIRFDMEDAKGVLTITRIEIAN